MRHNKLYKLDSNGKVRVWYIEAYGSRYRIIAGVLGSDNLVTSDWTSCVATNIGRSNHRDGVQQCQAEVLAEYKKKKAQGRYVENIEDVNKETYFEPMLARTYAPKLLDNDNSVYVQPKLDGVRCIARKDGLFTRKGKPITAVPHIGAALLELFEDYPGITLDGELYVHSLADDFSKIISLVRKKDPNLKQIKEAAIIEYHVYDMFSNRSFRDRFSQLKHLLLNLNPSIRVVETEEIVSRDIEHINAAHAEFISEGYEGSIIRHSLAGYEKGKRSKSLLKRKDFITEDFKIVEVYEGRGNRSGMAGGITYDRGDGTTFGSGIKGGVATNKDIWKRREELKGGTGTVRFFEYTPDGIPRFPVTLTVFENERTH